jgi:hypothetical protein
MPDAGWRRRQAIQIVSQLPEDTDDALAVLDLAVLLVKSFLVETQPALVAVDRADRSAEIKAFPASASSR